MLNLSKEIWVEKDLCDEKLGISAKFRLIKYRDFKIVAETDGTAIIYGKDEAKKALGIIAKSIKDIQGVEVKEGKAASYQDILEHGSLALVAAFLETFLLVQQDQDFLTK